jgi:ornithine cyclodeaminase
MTALGADGNGKQELDPAIFRRADLRIVDSLNQCAEYGESSFALKQGLIQKYDLIELGQVIAQPQLLARNNDHQISIVDLTGLAIQDLQIAKAVCIRHQLFRN